MHIHGVHAYPPTVQKHIPKMQQQQQTLSLADILDDPNTDWSDIRNAIKTNGRGSFLGGPGDSGGDGKKKKKMVSRVTTNAGLLNVLHLELESMRQNGNADANANGHKKNKNGRDDIDNDRPLPLLLFHSPVINNNNDDDDDDGGGLISMNKLLTAVNDNDDSIIEDRNQTLDATDTDTDIEPGNINMSISSSDRGSSPKSHIQINEVRFGSITDSTEQHQQQQYCQRNLMSSAEEGEETSTSKTNNTTLERRHSDTTQQASNKKSTATTAASLSDDDDDNNIKRQHQFKKKNKKKFFGITEVQFRGCSSTRGTSRGEHEHDVIEDVDANTDDLNDNNNDDDDDYAGEREVQKVVSSRRIMPAKLYSKRRASLDSVAEDVQATLGDLATTTANNNCLIANQLE